MTRSIHITVHMYSTIDGTLRLLRKAYIILCYLFPIQLSGKFGAGKWVPKGVIRMSRNQECQHAWHRYSLVWLPTPAHCSTPQRCCSTPQRCLLTYKCVITSKGSQRKNVHSHGYANMTLQEESTWVSVGVIREQKGVRNNCNLQRCQLTPHFIFSVPNPHMISGMISILETLHL